MQYADFEDACAQKPSTSKTSDAEWAEEKAEKPSRWQKALKRLLNYLQLHHVFRRNRLTGRTECTFLSGNEEECHEPHCQPADSRMPNSISLLVLQAGVSCWDCGTRRWAESLEISSYHPFIYYMEHLPE